MSNIKLEDIDEFCRRMKITNKTNITIALLVELLDRFADEQVENILIKINQDL